MSENDFYVVATFLPCCRPSILLDNALRGKDQNGMREITYNHIFQYQ